MGTERTFEDVLHELIALMDNPITAFVDKAQEVEIAKGLSEVEGLPAFLKATMGADMRRYFAASPTEQQQIKGAFARTVYLLGLAVPKKNLDHTKDQLTGSRKSLPKLRKL